MVLAIIQARMGATRLPGKVLLPLGRGTALSEELSRVKRAKRIDKIVVATTTSSADDKLAEYLKESGYEYFRGSETDVLDRYWQTAKNAGIKSSDAIVRLTADCPLIDPAVIDEVVSTYLRGGYDFVSNSLEPYSYPDGMDCEVFSFQDLERAAREATLPSHREHVTFYFWQNPDKFKIYYRKYEKDLSKYRLTLDTPEDYELIKSVYEHFIDKDFDMQEVITFLDQHPDIKKINASIAHNAGWQPSLEKDKKFK